MGSSSGSPAPREADQLSHPETPEEDAAIRPRPLPSLRTNSVARLMADLLGIGFAFVAATITARLLGPAGKGYYSSLVLLGGLLIQVFAAGLGEAAIVLAGRARVTLHDAASATMLAILPLGILAAGLFWATAGVVLGAPSSDDSYSIAAGSLLVGINVWYTTVVSFLVAQERVAVVALLSIVGNTITTAALLLLLAWAGLGVSGALLAGALGSCVTLVTAVVLLRRADVSLRPRWRKRYLPSAARLGAALQFSNVLVLLTARLDLILVYRLSTPAAAGSYSIALTIGALVGAAPIAISYAAFPRLAYVDDDEAQELTAQVFRMGIAAAVVSGIVLASVTPLAVPLIFGREYLDAVAPTLLLVPGGVLWSAQWLLCRAAAARGLPRPLVASFAVSFTVMTALDFVLIGPFGATGAAIASLVGPIFGLLTAVLLYRSHWHLSWRLLVPGFADVTAFAETAKHLVRQARRGQPFGGASRPPQEP